MLIRLKKDIFRKWNLAMNRIFNLSGPPLQCEVDMVVKPPGVFPDLAAVGALIRDYIPAE
jgi:hypothetical protein